MTKQQTTNGFAVIETLLVILLVGVIVAVGFWVWKQRDTETAKNNTTKTVKVTSIDPAKAGTTAGIDQLTQLDGQDESNIDQKHASSSETNATSTNSTLTSLGGAYNESTL